MVRLGIPLIAGVFVWGSIDGWVDLERKVDVYVFQFHNKSDKELRFLLRNLEKCVLVRNGVTNEIEFYKWDDVNYISKPQSTQSESFVCWYWGLCPKNALPQSAL
jgi:hypothetical protein